MSFKTKHQASKAFQLCGQLNYGPRLFPEAPGWFSSLLWLGSGQLENLWPRQWFLNLAVLQNCLGRLLNTQMPGPPPEPLSQEGNHSRPGWIFTFLQVIAMHYRSVDRWAGDL